MTIDFKEKLKTVCGDVRENEMMSQRTTFRVGGAAQLFAEPSSEEEVCGIIRLCREYGVDYTVVGNGSNLLVRDGGIDGVVICIGARMSDITVDGVSITAQAGAMLSKVSRTAEKYSLTGLEFASGIPGTLGGGMCMNAGAYGGELKDVAVSVVYADENGDIHTVSGDDICLSYRHSMFSDRKCVVLKAVMDLKEGDSEKISEAMKEYSRRRAEKQPLELPSAGSTFKRPEGYFAGKLIEDAGLKGFSCGGAQVSEKHAGFVVNKGGASASDIERLIECVQKDVYEKFGVKLEPEVKIIGKKV